MLNSKSDIRPQNLRQAPSFIPIQKILSTSESVLSGMSNLGPAQNADGLFKDTDDMEWSHSQSPSPVSLTSMIGQRKCPATHIDWKMCK